MKDEIDTQDLSTEELLAAIQGRGYFVAKSPLQSSGRTFKVNMKRWSGRKFRFGVVSCTHLGSRYQQLTALRQFYRMCAQRKIDTVFHCGDLVDGTEKMHRGMVYEIFVHGADAQTQYAIDNYPRHRGMTTRIISGNHDQSFLKDAGVNIVKNVCKERDDMVFLGDDMAYVQLGNINIGLMHGRGGVAYARSYKGQKIVEQLAPENKPHLLFIGHYHVPCIIPGYRNVELVQMSCFQSQTPYLVGKGLFPFVAGLIVTAQEDDKGLAKVTYEWIPFYEHIKDDY